MISTKYTEIITRLNSSKNGYRRLLIEYCELEDLDAIKYIMTFKDKYNIDIHFMNDHLLKYATIINSEKMIKFIFNLPIEYGKFDIHCHNDILFNDSYIRGNIEIINFLFSLNEADTFDIYKIYNIIKKNNYYKLYHIIELFLFKKIEYNIDNINDAFKYAVKKNNSKIIKFLLNIQVDHEFINFNSEIFKYACLNQNYLILELFLFTEQIYITIDDVNNAIENAKQNNYDEITIDLLHDIQELFLVIK